MPWWAVVGQPPSEFIRHFARVCQELLDMLAVLNDMIVQIEYLVRRLARNVAQSRILTPEGSFSDPFIGCREFVAACDDLVQVGPFLDHRLADKDRGLINNLRSWKIVFR